MNSSPPKLRVLFAIRSYLHFPLFRRTVHILAQRGHTVLVVFHKELVKQSLESIRAAEEQHSNVRYEWAQPSLRERTFVFHSREVLTYRKHLLYGKARTFYEDRWRKYLHPRLQELFQQSWAKALLKTKIAGSFLRLIEKATPPQKNIVTHLQEWKPDVIVVSPVNLRYSSVESEYLKAGVALGIPTILSVASWDNITCKGIYHITPTRFFVWNEVQAAELMDHHHIARDIIRTVGASNQDQWLPLPTHRTREEFCAQYGLNPQYPILAYFCSSTNISKDETDLVIALRDALRKSHDERVRNTQIVFRPHPKNFKAFVDTQIDGVWVVPRGGPLPNSNEEQQVLYNTLYHATALVGINTSSMLDAMVLGKPVIALLTEQYKPVQMETYHFPPLLEAETLDLVPPEEAPVIVQKLLDGNDVRRENRKRFVETFIRPHGIHKSAAEITADEIENIIFK